MKTPNFIEQHYEKILLSGTLAILTLISLGFVMNRENEARAPARLLPPPPENPPEATFPPRDRFHEAVKKLRQSEAPKLDEGHHLFNPKHWAGLPGERPQPVESIGIGTVRVEALTPLHWTLEFKRYRGIGDRPRYWMIAEDETLPKRDKNRRRNLFLEPDRIEENLPVVLRAVEGPVASPGKLIFEDTETGDPIEVAPDSPYQRVLAWRVTLRHPASKQTFQDITTGDRFKVTGEYYRISHITGEQIIVENIRNQRRYYIPTDSTPGGGDK